MCFLRGPSLGVVFEQGTSKGNRGKGLPQKEAWLLQAQVRKVEHELLFDPSSVGKKPELLTFTGAEQFSNKHAAN